MCKKIIKILDKALNVLGCNKRHLVYTVPDGDRPTTIDIVWSGKAMQVSYTQHVVPPRGGRAAQRFQPIRHNYADGEETFETFDIFRGLKPTGKYSVVDNALYINCTNVTHLEINEEPII